MYNCCKKGDFINVVLKNGTVIKGTVTNVEKVFNEWRNIISLDKNAYIKHISDLDLTSNEYKLNSADISIMGIK